MQFNYYSVLGVKRSATRPEIKAAYKRLAIQYHPDKHQGNAYFEEQFKQVNEAYQILSDPVKRRNYDLKLDYVIQQQRAQQYAQATYQQTRQRPPASVRERYYRPIPKRKQFSRRDLQITIGFFLIIILGSLMVNQIMDYVTAKNRFRKAGLFMEQKQWSSAHSLLSEAIRFEPDFTEAYQRRAYINHQIYHDYPAAVEDYNAILDNTSKPDAATYHARGQCFSELSKYSQAEADFTTAIRLDEQFLPAYFSRGEVRLLQLGSFPGAIKDLSFYLKNPGGQAEANKALLYRGFAYYLVDQYARSIQDYEQALENDPKNGRLYYLLGKSEYALDQTSQACDHFAHAYQLGYEASVLDWRILCGSR